MYCRYCGKELKKGANECSSCGKSVEEVVNRREYSYRTNSSIMKVIRDNFWTIVLFLTCPTLLIIRLNLQQKIFVPAGTGGSWRSYSYYDISIGTKVMLFGLLGLSTILAYRKIGKNHSLLTLGLTILNVLLGAIIILAKPEIYQ